MSETRQHTFRCTDKEYRKVRRAAIKQNVSEAQIIRNLINSL